MSRSERLLDLLQILRRHRRPVAGQALAEQLSISIRTLYRDIASLQASGAHIEGSPGLGYVLKPGFTLPPLMFATEEIEAVTLGVRWVIRNGDVPLSEAARDALAKIVAVLPVELREQSDNSALMVGSATAPPDIDMAALRQAIRAERKVALGYLDAAGARTERIVWPFILGFFERVRVVGAWCEMRQGFRHFRIDRIQAMRVLEERYPRRRPTLLKTWRETECIE